MHFRISLLLLAFFGALCAPAGAHTIRPAVATVNVAEDGALDLQIRLNLEILLAGIDWQYTDTNDSPNADQYDKFRSESPDVLTERFVNFLPDFMSQALLTADGQPVRLQYESVTIPPVGDIELARDSTIVLSGMLPGGAERLVWRWPDEYGSSVIRFMRADDAAILSQWLQPGESSPSFELQGVGSERSTWDVVRNYAVIGFEHIVPKGLDHILFVVGIFLLSLHLKPILLQVTAFTVAHTITLGLSIYGVISLPPSIVEPLIALSIAYVGIENCFSSKLHSWRVVLVFAFGLLHGLGFAGVLSEIGLPPSDYLTALLSFNVGVEIGQLVVIMLCLASVGWWRHRDWYRSYIVVPASAVIALTGLYWTWERISF
jgi:hydrogenase/urease accessory protein HupE